jgi:hypothetical protein
MISWEIHVNYILFLQERVDEIADEARIVSDRIDELRSALGSARYHFQTKPLSGTELPKSQILGYSKVLQNFQTKPLSGLSKQSDSSSVADPHPRSGILFFWIPASRTPNNPYF